MVGGELSEYWPEDPENFCLGVDATIGPAEGEGGEIFSFEVCSPRWLELNRTHDATFIRNILIVNIYDQSAIKNALDKLVDGVSGQSWSEIANTLARYMFWEYEDYQPPQHR